eukprot:10163299-Alexandrium_andersonii.AAC.1
MNTEQMKALNSTCSFGKITVATTYALYVLTEVCPFAKTAEEKKDIIKSLNKQLAGKKVDVPRCVAAAIAAASHET